MTNERKCGIINELLQKPDGSHRASRNDKKSHFWKNLEKVFQKNLKKDLTNERKCGIINKSSERRHCILKSEQYWKANKELNPCWFKRIIKRSQEKTIKHSNCERIVMTKIFISEQSELEIQTYEEFDPGSGRTLAARLTHASRTVFTSVNIVADGWVTREQPAFKRGIASGNGW